MRNDFVKRSKIAVTSAVMSFGSPMLIIVICLIQSVGITNFASGQSADITSEWLVQTVNDGNNDLLYEVINGAVQLTPKAKDYVNNNKRFKGQVEFYLGEGAYKAAFSQTNDAYKRAFLNFSKEYFSEAISLGPKSSHPLSQVQLDKLYFRQAWCYFRLAELTLPSDPVTIKKHLNDSLFSIKHGKLLQKSSSIGVGAKYLSAEINLQDLRLAYWEKVNLGREKFKSSLHSLIRDGDDLFNKLSTMDNISIPGDDLVDIDTDKFGEAVRFSKISTGILLARLRMLNGENVDDLISGIYSLLSDTELDLFFEYELARLDWLRKQRSGGGKMEGLVDALSDEAYNHKYLLMELQYIDLMENDLLFSTSSVQEWVNGSPLGSYWLGKLQLIESEKAVNDAGGLYQPGKHLEDYLDSPRILGDDFFRMDAKLLLKEIEFEKAKESSGTERKKKLKKIAHDLVEFRIINEELIIRRNILLQKPSLRVYVSGMPKLDDEEALILLIGEASTAPTKPQAKESLKAANARLKFRKTELGDDRFYFYSAIVKLLGALANQNYSPATLDSLKASMAATEKIDSGSDYSSEGKYIGALSAYWLHEGQKNLTNWKKAEELLSKVVKEEKNIRALYYLSALYSKTEHESHAKQYSLVVKEVITRTPFYDAGYFKTDKFYELAEKAYSLIGCDDKVEIVPGSGDYINTTDFKYPCITMPPKSGSSDPSRRYFEGFADKFVLNKEKRMDLQKTIGEFFPLPMNVYVSEIENSGWLLDSCYPNLNSGISEGPKKSMSGLNMLVYPTTGKDLLFGGKEISPNSTTKCYVKKDIISGSKHDLYLSVPGYFDFVIKQHKFSGTPIDSQLSYVHMAKLTEYDTSGDEIDLNGLVAIGDGNVVYSSDSIDHIDYLKNKLGFEVRDFVRIDNFFYCISVVENTVIRVAASGKGTQKPFTKGHRFVSPEGIAVDKDHNFYVTDFGANQIVVFNSEGEYSYKFGLELGDQKLEFPTRITIEEDTKGFLHDGRPYFFPSFVYVSDWNGVHRMGLYGNPIDTVVTPDNSDIKRGDFYGISVEGYGSDAVLTVVKRNGENGLKYTAAEK